jgi:hypothetical protein
VLVHPELADGSNEQTAGHPGNASLLP